MMRQYGGYCADSRFLFSIYGDGINREELAQERAVCALHLTMRRVPVSFDCLTELAIKDFGFRRRSFARPPDRGSPAKILPPCCGPTYSRAQALAERLGMLLRHCDRVGGTLLTRHERVASVRAALDAGRYVELRAMQASENRGA